MVQSYPLVPVVVVILVLKLDSGDTGKRLIYVLNRRLYFSGRVELNTFKLTVKAEMFGFITDR